MKTKQDALRWALADFVEASVDGFDTDPKGVNELWQEIGDVALDEGIILPFRNTLKALAQRGQSATDEHKAYLNGYAEGLRQG